MLFGITVIESRCAYLQTYLFIYFSASRVFFFFIFFFFRIGLINKRLSISSRRMRFFNEIFSVIGHVSGFQSRCLIRKIGFLLDILLIWTDFKACQSMSCSTRHWTNSLRSSHVNQRIKSKTCLHFERTQSRMNSEKCMDDCAPSSNRSRDDVEIMMSSTTLDRWYKQCSSPSKQLFLFRRRKERSTRNKLFSMAFKESISIETDTLFRSSVKLSAIFCLQGSNRSKDEF